MWFSKTELEVVSLMGNENKKVSEIAKALNISSSQVYRVGTKLKQKGIVSLRKGMLRPEMKTHVNMLLRIMSYTKNLATPLSGTGLKVYVALLEPKTVKEVEKETGLHKTTIAKKIREGRKISLLLMQDKKYRVNEKVWQNVRDCLMALKKYEESVDTRVPVNSTIYFKNEKEIVFSNKEELDAEETAFSVYEKYGIKLYNITYYFYLPKKELNKEDVFMHSLYVAEKDLDFRSLMYAALFYAKYRNELSGIKHQILNNFNKIFDGQKIPGYPPLKEIQEKLEIYDIKLPIYN